MNADLKHKSASLLYRPCRDYADPNSGSSSLFPLAVLIITITIVASCLLLWAWPGKVATFVVLMIRLRILIGQVDGDVKQAGN